MKVRETKLEGCFVFSPEIHKDERGYFFESCNEQEVINAIGKPIHFVQDNQSVSKKGVIRGLHYQKEPYAQSKLVRVIQGKILDVCVDIRKNSLTYGKHFSIVLDHLNQEQLFIPKGFAHGFLALEDNTVVSYKCDNYYHIESEAGIKFNDKVLNIDWKYPSDKLLLSKKDNELPTFESLL